MSMHDTYGSHVIVVQGRFVQRERTLVHVTTVAFCNSVSLERNVLA